MTIKDVERLLPNQRITAIGKAADMMWLAMGDDYYWYNELKKQYKKMSKYALHLQCPWRITRNSDIIVASFDFYVEYETPKGETGVIGIEVKYTEEGYSVGNKEFAMMQNPVSAYSITTRNSECFINNDPMQFNNPDYIQLWRNHILGLAMLQQGMTDFFDSLTLYPTGNAHFHSSGGRVGVIEAYEKLLTEKGQNTFHAITYEDFFCSLGKYYKSRKNIAWLEYLDKRYINRGIKRRA